MRRRREQGGGFASPVSRNAVMTGLVPVIHAAETRRRALVGRAVPAVSRRVAVFGATIFGGLGPKPNQQWRASTGGSRFLTLNGGDEIFRSWIA